MEQKLKQDYRASFPKWLQLLIFMKRALYNGGGWKWKWARVPCWFERHEWGMFLYSVEAKEIKFYEKQDTAKGYGVSFSLQCKHCGESKKFSGQIRGYGEHRIQKVIDK
jgi:hypothetical protein